MLTDRQLLILQVVIDDFIRSAHPIGSRSLAKKEKISLSSATIRNEMADLEELGFIEKTHTSSGRVPSEKGYRFYVDHLISPEKIALQELQKIKSIFNEKIYELEKIIQNSASVLSELTKYTAVVLGPTVKENKLSKFQILPLNEETAVAIIVTNTGHIEHKLFSLPKSINKSDLEKTVNILNHRLVGNPLVNLQEKLFKEVAILFKEHIDNYDFMIQSVADVLNIPLHEKLYYGGKINMLKQPEFQDIEKVHEIMNFLEEESGFYHLLKETPFGINVKIGTENNLTVMDNCSLITATYNIGQEQVGTIAILGPKRMHYSRVISIMNLLSNDLSNALSKLYSQ
ncbi:heat-inducible transcriptional repressor HrcA [Caldibacillus lycopersici]|uniref:Heat-inducible transcription repressor HrcA n=1 Tax=Perspicuibacillus lycopersici TaxID=1325689 RepID=A0AAE3IW37_9BACI|nr:heat-inducible transcriptional repressor HrcA [Perspicuibacillus lycopersici]MCU9613934.1 heat-inducible transcriptional repressor HrcA [Perspicuibacillus lycopersici]